MATKKNGNGKHGLEKWNHEITELELFAENEGKLYPSKKRVIAQMKTKIEQGQYDADLAVKGWRHWVDQAVEEYGRQFRMTDLDKAFPAIVRNEVARRVAEGEADSIRNGEYGALEAKPASKSPKAGAKYHTKYEGPTNTRGSRIIVTVLATKKRKTVPYDYGARDAHEAALATVIGDTEGLQGVDDGSSGKYWKGAQSRGEQLAVQHAKAERRVRARAAKVDKMPRINLGRIHLNSQGYTATGRYFGVGKPLFRAYNTANNQEIEFRASDRPQAMAIVKMMFAEPRHASVTERFTPGQVKEFVSNE